MFKRILVAFLCFLPFQWGISNILLFLKMDSVATVMKSLDEVLIIVSLFPIVCIRLLKLPSIHAAELRLALPLALLAIWDLISGMANENPFIITLAGSFFHLKNFIVVFLFSSMSWTRAEISNVYDKLKRIAMFLSIIAIIQEIVMLIGRYALGQSLALCPFIMNEWRAGFYRAPSLVGHPNILGVFALLILAIELQTFRKSNLAIMVLVVAILTTFSRIIYAGFCVIAVPRLTNKMLLLLPLLLSLIFIVVVSQVSFQELGVDREAGTRGEQLITVSYFRAYTIEKSFEIWRNSPVFGTGVGMYGDVISFMFKSPIYEKYAFDPTFFKFASIGKTLDQFYPVILAETGAVGLFWFLIFFASLFLAARIAERKLESSSFEKSMARGLSYLPIALVALLSVMSINMTFFFFPYLAMLGMLISYTRTSGNIKREGEVDS